MAFFVGLQTRWSRRGAETEVISGGRLMIRLVSASSGDMRKCKKEAATSSVNSPRLQCSSCARINEYKRLYPMPG